MTPMPENTSPDRIDPRLSQPGAGIPSFQIRHAYTWFGPLTAHQWLFLAAARQRRHRKQILSILENELVTKGIVTKRGGDAP